MKTLFKILISSSLLLTLSACGLAEKVDDLKKSYATLSVLFKQGVSTEFDEVWVQLKKVDASDDAGNTQTLYDNVNGKPINLVSPDSVAQLVNAVSLPTSSFSFVDVTLSSQVKVVNKQGLSLSFSVRDTPQDYQVRLPANIQLLANNLASIALGLDLSTIVPDQLNQIIPTLTLDSNTQAVVDRIVANLQGTVVSVNNGTVTIKPADGSAPIVVSLNAAGAVLNELTGQSIASLSALSVNDLVEVYGNYNSQRAQLVALTVTRNAERLHYGSEADVNGRVVKAEGFITAIDANTFTMDVKEASFVPEGNTIDVIDFANAAYLHGNQSTLAIGVKVEVKGVWDGQQLIASRMEIEGASRYGDSSSSSELVEVKGAVTSVQGNILTMTVNEVEHAGFALGSTLSVDLDKVWFKKGNSSCLTSGVEVEVKGVTPDGQQSGFQANLIEVESGSCATLPESEFDDDRSDEREGSESENEVENSEKDELDS